MEFRRGHLLYFVTVAEQGQITRAAHKLHIAQPALSQAIAQLEADLGLQLLDRHARGVRLTPAGEQFLVKAREALSAWTVALATAQSFAHEQQGTIEFGFLGSPPGLDSPEQLQRFASWYPGIDVRYRELPFPTVPTSTWLSDVDVAVCHTPPADPKVWSHTLRSEPRAVLAPSGHRLAALEHVTVEELLEETFIGFHPRVAPDWAGFWSLDDHRGRPPEHSTSDHAANPQEVLAALALRDAVTTVPASVAHVLASVFSGVSAVELRGAAPATIALCGHSERRNPRVAALLEFARGGRPRPLPV